MEIILICILTALVVCFGAIIWIQSERIDQLTKYIQRLEIKGWNSGEG